MCHIVIRRMTQCYLDEIMGLDFLMLPATGFHYNDWTFPVSNVLILYPPGCHRQLSWMAPGWLKN